MNAEEYVEIGHYLRDVRENFGLTPEQAASQLHMRVKYILNIENGRLEDMPGRAYLRGYVRNYAEYLQLDSRAILLRYETLFASAEKAYFIPQSVSQNNMPSGLLIVVCLLLLAGGYSYWYNSLAEKSAAPDPIPNVPVAYSPMPQDTQRCLEGNTLLFCRLEINTEQENIFIRKKKW